jgi:hypothetical protein
MTRMTTRAFFALTCCGAAWAFGAGCGGSDDSGAGGAAAATSASATTSSQTTSTSGSGGETSSSTTSGSGGGCACVGCEVVAEVEVGSFPFDVQVNDTYAYWTNQESGEIMRAPKAPDGSAPELLQSGLIKPWGLFLTSNEVYWCEYDPSSVPRSMPLDGGAYTDLMTSLGSFPGHYIIVTDKYVFWSTEPDDIWRCDIGGQNCYLMQSANILSNKIEHDTDFLYWVNRGDSRVVKAPLDGSSFTDLAVAQAQPWGVAIDDSYVYWSSFDDGKLQRADKTDGNNVVELHIDGKGTTDIIVDDTHLYWANEENGTISKVPKDGGEVVVIANCQGKPTNVTLDDSYIYWAASDDQMVMRAPK